MLRDVRIALSCLLVLVLVPGWTGEERLPLLGSDAQMTATRVALDRMRRGPVRIGAMTFLGGVALSARDAAFGGFSSLSVDGDRFTLLSDSGNIVTFRLGSDWRVHAIGFANLPTGPGRGWEKRDRDSESMTRDPAGGRVWVGFEAYNAIWRYAPGFARAESRVAPAAMARWTANGGPESLVRLQDGRFLTISETTRPKGASIGRQALMFAGDPTLVGTSAFAFVYRPMPGYDPSDATQLPDGRIVVLERRFSLPFAWRARIAVLDPAAIRPGAAVAARTIAILAPPLAVDNFEGVAATREGAATMLWLVSDDNHMVLQRSLLLKFRLDTQKPRLPLRKTG